MASDFTRDIPIWSISILITPKEPPAQQFFDRINTLINKTNRHEILEYAGNPIGSYSITGPRLCFDTVGGQMYYKPRGSTGTAGWVLI